MVIAQLCATARIRNLAHLIIDQRQHANLSRLVQRGFFDSSAHAAGANIERNESPGRMLEILKGMHGMTLTSHEASIEDE
jgi:hypothetical protein